LRVPKEKGFEGKQWLRPKGDSRARVRVVTLISRVEGGQNRCKEGGPPPQVGGNQKGGKVCQRQPSGRSIKGYGRGGGGGRMGRTGTAVRAAVEGREKNGGYRRDGAFGGPPQKGPDTYSNSKNEKW